MPTPLVTAIVDTFNHEDFVEQALESVLNQGLSSSELEILVIDDGSWDGTIEKVQKFANRVRILRKENGGQASAFNLAIPLARGEIVAFLDGDDWWTNDKLRKVIDVFGKDSHIGVVGHGFYEVDEVSGNARTTLPDSNQPISLCSLADAVAFRRIMTFLGTSRVAIRSGVLSLVGEIPTSLIVEADEFMSTMAVAKSQASLLSEPLTFYRLHGGNLYQFREMDVAKVHRKMKVLTSLGIALRRELAKAELQLEVIDAAIEPIDVEAKRLRLSVDGGFCWETFGVERASMRLDYTWTSWRYKGFKVMVLALSIILPPKIFYRLRHYYGKMNLRRLRAFTGEPLHSGSVVFDEINNHEK